MTNKLSFCSVVGLRLYGNIYMYIWNQWQSGTEYNILILPVTSKHLVGNGELGSLFQFSYSDGTSCTRKVGYLNFPPSSFVLLSEVQWVICNQWDWWPHRFPALFCYSIGALYSEILPWGDKGYPRPVLFRAQQGVPIQKFACIFHIWPAFALTPTKLSLPYFLVPLVSFKQ